MGPWDAIVTMLGYQQALCDLVASPAICLKVRANPADALSRYDLTDRERERLACVVHQRGMSTSCSLYRVNRITPIYSYLRLTCTLLGDELIAEMERFWREGKPSDLQFGSETLRFAAFLRRRLAEGAISDPYIEEILRLELAVNDLRWNRDPPVRIVRFRHSPEPLLAALAEGRRPIGEDIPAGNDYFLVLDARSGEIEFTRIDGHVPKAFAAFNGAAKSGR